jgi:hypothetical protein
VVNKGGNDFAIRIWNRTHSVLESHHKRHTRQRYDAYDAATSALSETKLPAAKPRIKIVDDIAETVASLTESDPGIVK